MNKIVIFGADGFIGRHLVEELAKSPGNTIVAFDRFSLYQTGTNHPFEAYPNVQIMTGDFFNRDSVGDALHGATYVFHLISTTNPATSIHDPLIDVDTNIRGSVELLQLCVENGIKKVIFLSSGGTVYGEVDSDKIDETMITSPESPYAIGKLTIENYLRYFKSTQGLDYIIYRVANPYGPGQNVLGKQGVVPIFMHKVLEKEPLNIFGDGSMVRDYFYIGDLTRMITESYFKQNKYNEYNLGSGKGTTVSRLVEAIESCAGYVVVKNHSDVPPTYIHKSVLSIDRFVNEFSISPSTSLEDGLKRTWDYVNDLE